MRKTIEVKGDWCETVDGGICPYRATPSDAFWICRLFSDSKAGKYQELKEGVHNGIDRYPLRCEACKAKDAPVDILGRRDYLLRLREEILTVMYDPNLIYHEDRTWRDRIKALEKLTDNLFTKLCKMCMAINDLLSEEITKIDNEIRGI